MRTKIYFKIALLLLLCLVSVNAGIIPVPSYSARVRDVVFSGDLTLGNTINLNAYVENTGADFSPSSRVWFFVVENDEKTNWIGPSPCYPLRTGNKKWYSYPLTLKSSGKYTVCGEIWNNLNGKSYSLSGKVCNSFYVRAPRIPTYSTSVTRLWDVKIKEDEKARLWAEVKNTGEVALGDNCEVRYWVRGPSGGISGYIGDIPSGDLSVGKTRWYSYDWKIPRDAESGTYKYWAIVECNGKKVSKWSGAKSFQVTSKIPTYSAKVTQLWNVKIKEDGRASFWAKVENTGALSIDSRCKVRYWVQGPGINTYIGDKNCWINWNGGDGPLRPGGGRWYEFKWPLVYPGKYKYWALVECNGKKVSVWSKPKTFQVTEGLYIRNLN